MVRRRRSSARARGPRRVARPPGRCHVAGDSDPAVGGAPSRRGSAAPTRSIAAAPSVPSAIEIDRPERADWRARRASGAQEQHSGTRAIAVPIPCAVLCAASRLRVLAAAPITLVRTVNTNEAEPTRHAPSFALPIQRALRTARRLAARSDTLNTTARAALTRRTRPRLTPRSASGFRPWPSVPRRLRNWGGPRRSGRPPPPQA